VTPHPVTRRFVPTPSGTIHVAEAGEGRPLLCLHQTPRSWDEYRDVLPHLAPHVRAIAMDTIGFGDSDRLTGPASIEAYATAAFELLDAVGIQRTSLLGHHTGGVIAVEMAARHPDRIDALVLSSTPLVDADTRERRRHRAPIDHVTVKPDGSHLAELWQRRAGFYPVDRPDIMHRFVFDAMRVIDAVEDGHRAVSAYRMEDVLGRVTAPTLCIGADADPHAFPDLERVAARITGARTAVVHGGMVPVMEMFPAEVARLVVDFLDHQ
jgi:pimeloyl-ACP methyl ester carboxylesterase